MSKTILITGSTDGIGLETAKKLAADGHSILLHGRSAERLAAAASAMPDGASVETYMADLSRPDAVRSLAKAVRDRHDSLDVLINNAGVYGTAETVTAEGLDMRFAVNTIAPYVLTRELLPIMGRGSRIVNLSSAAQAPVDLEALTGGKRLSDGAAYAQSKLALTMWSRSLADELGEDGPVVVAVNPGSLLGTKMVKAAFGTSGNDIGIGVDILSRAATSDEFADASGRYYDNDGRRFAFPHADAQDADKREALMRTINGLV